MEIKEGKIVELKYTSRVDGKLIDQNLDQSVFYIHGKGFCLAGIEKALEGKNQGDEIDVILPPEDAYGLYDLSNIDEIDLSAFTEQITVGQTYEGETEDGEIETFTVLEICDDKVKVDFNHPYAGKPVEINVKVISVREPTPEEIQEGCIIN